MSCQIILRFCTYRSRDTYVHTKKIKTIWPQMHKLWANESLRDLSLCWVSEGYHILQQCLSTPAPYFIRDVSLWKGSNVNSTSFIYAPVKYVIIGSGDVLSPVRITVISWANDDVLLIGYVGTNLVEIWNEIQFHLRTCMRKYRLRNVKHSVSNQCFNWQYTSLGSGKNLRVDRRPSHYQNQCRPSSLTHICITKSSNNVWEGG